MERIELTAAVAVRVTTNNSHTHHNSSTVQNNSGNKFGRKIRKPHIEEDAVFFIVTTMDNKTCFAKELIVRDGKIFAMDTFSLKGAQVKSAKTAYALIMPDDDGGLIQFSRNHFMWFPCSVQNGVYTRRNAISDVHKYHLYL